MKRNAFLSTVFCFLFSFNTFGQEGTDQNNEKLGFYPSLSLLVSAPKSDFQEIYPRSVLWGINVDGIFSPIGKNHIWQPGLQLEFSFVSNSADQWQGIEVTTFGMIYKINAINRFRFTHSGTFDPFLEFGAGLLISATNTKYVVEEGTTFVEELLFNADPDNRIEREKVKRHRDLTSNFVIGAGAIIKEKVIFQVKYNPSPEIEYVISDDINIDNNSINYGVSKSKLKMLTFSLGLSF